MTSLRLALKQSLEESSGGFSPPSIGSDGNQQQQSTTSNMNNPTAPPSPGGSTLRVTLPAGPNPPATAAPGQPHAPASNVGQNTPQHLKKRGPGRPRKFPLGDKTTNKRGRPKKHPSEEGDHEYDGESSSENEYSGSSDHEEGEVDTPREGGGDEHMKQKKKKAVAVWGGSVSDKEQQQHNNEEGSDHHIGEKSSVSKPHLESAQAEQPKPSNDGEPGTASASTVRDKEPEGRQAASRAKTVPAPDHRVLRWSRSLPVKQARHAAQQGLRVKVRFATRVKRDGKLVRKKKWYGGVVSQVSKAGSKIRIKYDDGTSEISKFPDKEIVVDDAFNGQHSCAAEFFIPPDNMSDDDEVEAKEASDQETEENQKPKAVDVSPPQEASTPAAEVPHSQQPVTLQSTTTKQSSDEPAVETVEKEQEQKEVTESVKPPPLPAPVDAPAPAEPVAQEETKKMETASEKPETEPEAPKPDDDLPKPKRKRGRPPKVRADEDEAPQPQNEGELEPVAEPVEEESNHKKPPIHERAQSPPVTSPPIVDALVDTPVANEQPPKIQKIQQEQQQQQQQEPVEAPKKTDEPRFTAEDQQPRPPRGLSIRIPSTKSNEAEAVSDAVASSVEPPRPPLAEKKDPGEESPTRIHISMPKTQAPPPQSADTDAKDDTAPQETAQVQVDSGRTTPPPPAQATQKRVETELKSPASPVRAKKVKRKRTELSPRPRSRSPKPPADSGPTLPLDGPGTLEKTKAGGEAGEKQEKAITPRVKQTKAESRSSRRSGQEVVEAKEDSTNDQVSKKKKKRDRRRENEGGEDSEKEESQQAPWVQCDKCKKWRIIPSNVVGSLPDRWFCEDNVWDPKRASCEAPQQKDKQLVRERKRRKRQRLLEKERESKPEGNDGNSEGSNDKEANARAQEEPDESNNTNKRKRSSPTEEMNQSDSSNVVEKPAKTKKVHTGKKTRSNLAAAEEVEAKQEEAPEAKPRRGRPRRNAGKEANPPSSSNNQPQDESADNVEWVQCEKCEKWRKLPPHISADELPDVWYCSMNTWNTDAASCSAPEDKAEAGLTDIFSNGENKLSYRNLIFGNGRKFNRAISERTRAAESIFASVSDDTDAPPAVSYANSSAFISRSKLNQMDDSENFSVLELMGRSHLFEELRNSSGRKQNGLCAFDNLPPEVKESMKDLILHSLGSRTLTGDEVANAIQHRNWQNVPLGWAAARPHCSSNSLVMTMCELVREGVLECLKDFSEGKPGAFVLCYRRNQSYSKTLLQETEDGEDAKGKVMKFATMKFAKPWKSGDFA